MFELYLPFRFSPDAESGFEFVNSALGRLPLLSNRASCIRFGNAVRGESYLAGGIPDPDGDLSDFDGALGSDLR